MGTRSKAPKTKQPKPVRRVVVCAHCGGNTVREGDRDHLCMGALLDWFELQGQEVTIDSMIEYTDTLGI